MRAKKKGDESVLEGEIHETSRKERGKEFLPTTYLTGPFNSKISLGPGALSTPKPAAVPSSTNTQSLPFLMVPP